MKKLVFFVLITIILFFTFWEQQAAYQVEEDGSAYQVIPDEAIRLRILAHSDDEEDQTIKNLVRDAVNEQINEWVEELTDIDEARQLIQANVPEIKKIATAVLKEQESDQDLEVDYDESVTFPMKVYDTFVYPAGEYEAVLITIGDGKGANWWCVLFPPLCFLDFANASLVAVDDTGDDQEVEVEVEEEPTKVKFFLFEWFGWT